MNLKKSRKNLFLPAFVALPLFFMACAIPRAMACEESFELGGLIYSIPERWCGRMNDSGLIAEPAALARLPDSLSWREYRIYLTRTARDAFVEMAKAAAGDSVLLIVQSGYRSARYQRVIIRRRLAKKQKMETVLKHVAPPGYSEHETGMAVDMISASGPFEKSVAYDWLKLHAANFGFVESIPEDNTGIIPWEPWHWLYIVGLK